jgi:hypothetical protein
LKFSRVDNDWFVTHGAALNDGLRVDKSDDREETEVEAEDGECVLKIEEVAEIEAETKITGKT